MKRKQLYIAYDDDMYIEEPRRMDVHVAEDDPDAGPVIFVPDGSGDFRPHRVAPKRPRMGFL